MTVLTCRSVTGGYGPAIVLQDVSLEVSAGEIVGVLGANGAGKTTLLRALSGSLPRCTGSVELLGRELRSSSPWQRVKRGLVHVPEGRHVFGAMSVEDNLKVAALARRPRAAVDAVYELFPRLAERRDQLAGSMSGGEQQMLAIGRALMTGPRLLAIDEMSAGLAPVLVEQLVRGLVALRSQGLAILLVEQSPQLIESAVDRVYLLEGGRVVQTGTLSDVGGAGRLAEIYLGVTQ